MAEALALFRSANTTLSAAARQDCLNEQVERALLVGEEVLARLQAFLTPVDIPPASGFPNGPGSAERAAAIKKQEYIDRHRVSILGMITRISNLIDTLLAKPPCGRSGPSQIPPGGTATNNQPLNTPVPGQGGCRTAEEQQKYEELLAQAAKVQKDLEDAQAEYNKIPEDIQQLEKDATHQGDVISGDADQRPDEKDEHINPQAKQADDNAEINRLKDREHQLEDQVIPGFQLQLKDIQTELQKLSHPCPPPTEEEHSSSGFYLGGELVNSTGRVRSTERLAATDATTNEFADSADALGAGIIIGYKFAPWSNNVIVSPFASFDFMRAPVNHTFPGGSFLGTTANFMGTAGVKIGPQLSNRLWLYGIGGFSVLNETLNINFIPLSSSQSATVPGISVGFGGGWQPSFLQVSGRPVSLFLEYQHTWWKDADYNMPVASPLFNYNFARQDDVVKFGFTVPLDPAPAPKPSPIAPIVYKGRPSSH